MFKKKIAVKLIAGFIVIVLISMLTLGIIFLELFRQYAFQNHEQTMLTRARTIAAAMADTTQSNGQMRGLGSWMRFLDTLAEANVWLTDSQGNLTQFSGLGQMMGQGNGQGSGQTNGTGQHFFYNSEPLPAEAENVILEVLDGKESISKSFSSVYKEATITVGVPILNLQNQVIGTVLLHSPVTGVTAVFNKAFGIFALSLLLALLLAIVMGIFYSLQFTRPLKAMNRTAMAITKGDYSTRTGIKRQDELGQLGNSLDILAVKLGSTINQLFQEKGKLNDIISSISEGIIAFDLLLKPLSHNEALTGIMNRSQPYADEELTADLETLNIQPEVMEVMTEKKPVVILKDWFGKKLRFIFAPIIDNQGNVTGSVALVQDISESEQLEQLRRDFVANVSHEFRTPLTVIRGSLEALLDGTVTDNQDIRYYHERMLGETRSLERLVADLMELSRLQSGKITMNKEKIHLPLLLADTIGSLQTIADKKQITIQYSSGSNIPPIFADYDRIREIIVILLDNAVKYSPANTIITVSTGLNTDQTVSLKIQDHGYGIPPEDLPHIWDRFYKSDKARSINGTGLGLAIAKHLINLHNGKVNVQSTLNVGTIIEIILPV
jgi:two-component system sensor histidine kinase ResE